MFTGIIQAVGTVRSLQRRSAGVRLVVDAPDLSRPIPLGASICVSGVCLTVIACHESCVEFDVVSETLSRGTFGGLSVGDRVNLERSLRIGDGLEGHIVQGHVDGVASVGRIRRSDSEHVVTFNTEHNLMEYMIPKGSVAIDGVSLTIAVVTTGGFDVALIPTTLGWTTLGSLRVGQKVNIETDILVRTIITTMRRWRDSSVPAEPGVAITLENLRENGW